MRIALNIATDAIWIGRSVAIAPARAADTIESIWEHSIEEVAS